MAFLLVLFSVETPMPSSRGRPAPMSSLTLFKQDPGISSRAAGIILSCTSQPVCAVGYHSPSWVPSGIKNDDRRGRLVWMQLPLEEPFYLGPPTPRT